MRPLLIGLALVALPLELMGQAAISPTSGQHIRLWAPLYGIEKERAHFLHWDSNTVSILRVQPPDSVEVPLSAVTRLDAFQGQSTFRGVARGGVILGLVGATLGAVLTHCQPDDQYCPVGRIYYGSIGGLIGFTVGGIVGSRFPMDIWVRQELPSESP